MTLVQVMVTRETPQMAGGSRRRRFTVQPSALRLEGATSFASRGRHVPCVSRAHGDLTAIPRLDGMFGQRRSCQISTCYTLDGALAVSREPRTPEEGDVVDIARSVRGQRADVTAPDQSDPGSKVRQMDERQETAVVGRGFLEARWTSRTPSRRRPRDLSDRRGRRLPRVPCGGPR